MKPQYQIIEAALADTPRLLEYRQHANMDIHLNIKGFNYGWILDSVQWNPEYRVLDVGAGYSRLPIHIANELGCEVWAVDDFGLHEQGDFWERNQDPHGYIKDYPEIHYVIGRLGLNDLKELPEGYFDVIYSASALEHVPIADINLVWSHMDRLLKAGGHMLHGLDIAFPTSRGWQHVALALGFDFFYRIIPLSLRRRFVYETPLSYFRYVMGLFRVSGLNFRKTLSVLHMVLNPEIVTEPIEHTYNRMIKDGLREARFFRIGSLLMHLKKAG